MPAVALPDQLTASDVVVALAGCHGAEAIRAAIGIVTAAVRSIDPALTVTVAGDADPQGLGTEGQAAEGAVATIVPWTFAAPERFPAITPAPQDAYRVLFSLGRRAQARALLMLGSDVEHVTPVMVRALVEPAIEGGFDVVAPGYVRQVFDGLLNSAVVYPLTRALYGRRLQAQMGVDYCFSARVAERWDVPDLPAGRQTRPAWIIPQAVSDGLKVCQAALDVRLPPAPDGSDLSTLISKVLGSLFLDLEYRASYWQKVLRSQPVQVFGSPPPIAAGGDTVDVRPMIESFNLAYRNLRDVWTLLLPPATLVELKRLTTVPPDRFRLADGVWARIVFDFALGHRLRAMSRDHVLRALTPAYLAWVASYALEMQGSTPAAADARLEQLCLAFEAEKPYLVRRWRWPDRFNP